MSAFIYTTGRVVKISSKLLYIIHLTITVFISLYIIGYGIFWCGTYQITSPIESVVVTKVKGVIKTAFPDKELDIPNPELYNRIWDVSDIVIPSHGEESGGFFVLTNLVITPNQTRSTCPESVQVKGSQCKVDKDCPKGAFPLGNGFRTGKCVQNGAPPSKLKTCEVEAWCPTEPDKFPLKGTRALLEDTKKFKVLVKNSIHFTHFGPSYKRRNIAESATKEYLQDCVYDPKINPYCPTFNLGDIVAGANEDYAVVARTGAVFAIRVEWSCDFDFGRPISTCRPKYSFARLDNPLAELAPGFNFMFEKNKPSSTYHEENRRTLTRNYGIKFVIDVDGEGRKFDSVKLILTIGASVGLFALASTICDFIFGLLCTLASHFEWSWLSGYTQEMKYDLTFLKPHMTVGEQPSSAIDLDEVQVLKQK